MFLHNIEKRAYIMSRAAPPTNHAGGCRRGVGGGGVKKSLFFSASQMKEQVEFRRDSKFQLSAMHSFRDMSPVKLPLFGLGKKTWKKKSENHKFFIDPIDRKCRNMKTFIEARLVCDA